MATASQGADCATVGACRAEIPVTRRGNLAVTRRDAHTHHTASERETFRDGKISPEAGEEA